MRFLSRRSGLRLAALTILLSSVADRSPAADGTCQFIERGYGPAGRVAIRTETVASGLEVPWAIAFLPGGDMLVTERPGRIRRIQNGTLLPEPVATLEVSKRDEAGLLGLAVDPRFSTNRAIYVYYTADTGRGSVNRIERWTMAADGRTATRDRVLVDGIPAAQYHDGGRLRFGPDGMLYAGTGDAREPDRAQDPRSLAGKILRMTRDGSAPSDNPQPGQLPFVSGVRNVQAFDWDAQGRLYVADHGPSGDLGQSGQDRVMHAPAGANLGWPAVFGCGSRTPFAPTALSWAEAVPPGGAAIYTGGAILGWKGDFIVGTLRSQHLHRVRFDASDPSCVSTHEVYLEGDPPKGLGRIRDVTMGPDGELYVTTSNCDGRGQCPREKDRIVRIKPGP
jgi:glucose/arabinose dehydrogenase